MDFCRRCFRRGIIRTEQQRTFGVGFGLLFGRGDLGGPVPSAGSFNVAWRFSEAGAQGWQADHQRRGFCPARTDGGDGDLQIAERFGCGGQRGDRHQAEFEFEIAEPAQARGGQAGFGLLAAQHKAFGRRGPGWLLQTAMPGDTGRDEQLAFFAQPDFGRVPGCLDEFGIGGFQPDLKKQEADQGGEQENDDARCLEDAHG